MDERRSPAVSAVRAIVEALTLRRCPRCQSDRICRSHRRFVLERVASAVVLPYRCELCALRFFRVRRGAAAH